MAPPNNEDRMYTALAKSMVDDILQATDVSGMIPWCLIGEKMGTSVFRSELGSVGPVNVHGSREFEISAGDLMSSLSSFSTRTYCSMMKKIRSDEFIDGVILKTILSKSEDFPFRFMAIKSMKVKSSNPLKRAKEYVYLEYSDLFETETGDVVAFRVMQSVHFPLTPKSFRKKITKGHTENPFLPLTGMFIRSSCKEPFKCKVSYTSRYTQYWSELPTWAVNARITSFVEKELGRMTSVVASATSFRETFVLLEDMVPGNCCSHCTVCKRTFTFLTRRRHNCKKCGQVVCGGCSTVRSAKIAIVGSRQVRICTACNLVSRSAQNDSFNNQFCNSQYSNLTPSAHRCPTSCSSELDWSTSSLYGELRGVMGRVCNHRSFTCHTTTPSFVKKDDEPQESNDSRSTEPIEDGVDLTVMLASRKTMISERKSINLVDNIMLIDAFNTRQRFSTRRRSTSSKHQSFQKNSMEMDEIIMSRRGSREEGGVDYDPSRALIAASKKTAAMANQVARSFAHYAAHGLNQQSSQTLRNTMITQTHTRRLSNESKQSTTTRRIREANFKLKKTLESLDTRPLPLEVGPCLDSDDTRSIQYSMSSSSLGSHRPSSPDPKTWNFHQRNYEF